MRGSTRLLTWAIEAAIEAKIRVFWGTTGPRIAYLLVQLPDSIGPKRDSRLESVGVDVPVGVIPAAKAVVDLHSISGLRADDGTLATSNTDSRSDNGMILGADGSGTVTASTVGINE